jgi:hypothetical protein
VAALAGARGEREPEKGGGDDRERKEEGSFVASRCVFGRLIGGQRK